MNNSKDPRAEIIALPDDVLLTVREAMCLIGLSNVTLRRYRSNGNGPAYRRLSMTRVAYVKADVIEWLDKRRFRNVSHERDEAAKRQHANAA